MDDNILQPQQLDDIEAEQKKKVTVEKQAEADLVSVVVTPAWEEVKKLLEDKASDTAIVNKLRSLITDASVTDAQLGALTRATFIAATDVMNVLNRVLETVKAHE